MAFKKLIAKDELWNGEMRGIEVDGKKILVINVEDIFHVYEDRCVHLNVLLSKGTLEGNMLTCYAHGWQYNACTGIGTNPGGVKLKKYPVKIDEDSIWVDLEPNAGTR